MSEPISPLPVSSSTATGGGGDVFEQHVGAAFLSLLLVRGIPPCLPECQLVEVHFQTGHKGWATDDLLLVGTRAGGGKVHLAVQVKRSFSVSSEDKDFRKTIGDAWIDYTRQNPFNRATDAFAIITLRGTETLLNHFGGLLEVARFSLNSSDFLSRLGTPRLLHKKVKRYFDEVRLAVQGPEGAAPSPAEVLDFLRHLYLLSFDLNTPTAQTEGWVRSMLAHTAKGPTAVNLATATWNELLALVGAGKPSAASFAYENLPQSARERHSPIAPQDQQAILTLKHHSSPIRGGVRSLIGQGLHLERGDLTAGLLELLADHQVVIVTGPAGSGKSAVAGEVFDRLEREMPAFAFRAEEFARPHLDETLHVAQVTVTTAQLRALLALEPRKLIWIESVERLLEKDERAAFADLLQLLRDDGSCSLLMTCRDYSVDLVRSSILERSGLRHEVLALPPLGDPEIRTALDALPHLEPLTEKGGVRQLPQTLAMRLEKALAGEKRLALMSPIG